MVRLDRVFGVLLATVVVWSALHYRQVVGKVRERVEADAGYPDPASLVKIGSAAAAVYLALQGVFTWAVLPLADRLLPRDRWSPQVRRLLCSRFGAMAWKMLYFLCVSGVSFFSFREEPWWPAQIGGLGVEESLWEGYPMQRNSWECFVYFFVAFGHQLASLVYILKSSWMPDFFDLLLPCVAALCLIFFSFMSNFLRVGILILFCHDVCDIFTCGCKLLVDTPCRKLTVSLFVLLIAGWFYFRLYTFSSAALLPIFRAIQARQSHAEAEGWSFFVFILLTLFLMNIYWFVLMLKMLLHFVVSGQMSDLTAAEVEARAESSRPPAGRSAQRGASKRR